MVEESRRTRVQRDWVGEQELLVFDHEDTARSLPAPTRGNHRGLSGAVHDLPWIIALAGVLVTLAFAAAAAIVTRRRRDAERLAA